ncbi:MAG: dihydroorotase family protein [Candidatus Cloacimonadales bacterium]
MKKLLQNCQTAAGRLDILIADEHYEKIAAAWEIAASEADEIIDLSEMVVIPTMTDPHVHVRDLQQSEKEDWQSCSQAALSSGITTIFDMPNTVPPTTDWDSLKLKQQAAQSSLIDYKLFLGADPQNIVGFDALLRNNPQNIAGIKLFLAASSQNEIIDDKITLRNLFLTAKEHNLVVAVHTELQECLDSNSFRPLDPTAVDHDKIRPRECAVAGTRLVLQVAKEVGNKLVICHVSSKEELELIAAAKAEGQQVYCEVTPHHLVLPSSLTTKIGNWAKVNPPLRDPEDNLALLEGINQGCVDFIGTDHAPHLLQEKEQPYLAAPSGFPGVETALPILIDLYLQAKITLQRLVEITSAKANEIYNIDNEIKKGNRANLVIIDPAAREKISVERFLSKAKYSPFAGREVQGKISEVLYAGQAAHSYFEEK